MPAYINNRRWVDDQTRIGGHGEVIEYFIDSAADVASLPDATKIKETSTAIDIATGDVYALSTGGWGKIP